ncbi:MAG TPA: universal stress protein [Thermoplasmata archaeon]|nr:universal stress protein [Thermoplasmata archaeon]
MTPPDFRHITVAVDGSEHANAALEIAIDLARRYGSQLEVVAVAPLQPVMMAPNEPFVAAALPPTDRPRFQAIVEAAVKRAEAAGVTSVTGVCSDGVVVDELLGELEEHTPDLLVIGSRGLSAAKRLLIGSVSAAMVNHAPCPVLVVRPPTRSTKPAAR